MHHLRDLEHNMHPDNNILNDTIHFGGIHKLISIYKRKYMSYYRKRKLFLYTENENKKEKQFFIYRKQKQFLLIILVN